MRRLLLFILSMLTVTSVYAYRIWDEGYYSYDVYSFESVGSVPTGQLSRCTLEGHRNVYCYKPNNKSYELLLRWNPNDLNPNAGAPDGFQEWPELRGKTFAEDLIIPRGWIVLGTNNSYADITLPAQLGYMMEGDPFVYVEEEALDQAETLTFETSSQELIFGSSEYSSNRRITMERPVRFLAPLNPATTVQVPSGMKTYPRGLCYRGQSTLTIAEQYSELPDYCFRGFEAFTAVRLPESLTRIGNECFAGSSLESLRLPFYLSDIGKNIAKGSRLRQLYLPWLPTGHHYKCSNNGETDFYAFITDDRSQWNDIAIYLPSCAQAGRENYSGNNKPENSDSLSVLSHYDSQIRFQPAKALYLWQNGRVTQVQMSPDAQLSVPALGKNELLVVTADAGISGGRNIIVADRSDDKPHYATQHLFTYEQGYAEGTSLFTLPYDTHSDTLTFVSHKSGYKALRLPIDCQTDIRGWLGHNATDRAYLPSDTLYAGRFVLAFRPYAFSDSLCMAHYAAGQGPLIKATAALIEIREPEEGLSTQPSFGYPHQTRVTIPTITESRVFELRSLGDLYFFENYGRYMHGAISLCRDLTLPTHEIWTPVPTFDGQLNGLGHSIVGLNILPRTQSGNQGFIGQMLEGSRVESIFLGGTLLASDTDAQYESVGGVAGYCCGTISDCVIDIDVQAQSDDAGMVVGCLDPAASIPTGNLMLGRVVARRADRFRGGYYGLLMGRIGYNIPSDYAAARQLLDLVETNWRSETCYLSIEGRIANPSFFSNLNSVSGDDLNDDIVWLNRNRVATVQKLNNGEWLQPKLTGNKYEYRLRQNVSSPFAPVDSVPQPAEVKDPTLSYTGNRNYWLLAHNCLDFSGNGKCNICNKATTALTPIKIGTADELRAFAQQVNAATGFKSWYAVLTDDIDLQDQEWTPIGDNQYVTYDMISQAGFRTDSTAFRGVFDGKGHTIKGLKVSGQNDNRGLFGVVTDNALICNLVVEGMVEGNNNVGAIAGMVSRSEISSVISHVKVKGNAKTGGLVGAMAGSHARIANSLCMGNVQASNDGSKANGRVVGMADGGRVLGWDIQPVTLRNIYCPAGPNDENVLYDVGSGHIENARIYDADSISFRNDSVNTKLKENFYTDLLATNYKLTSRKLVPVCPVDSGSIMPADTTTEPTIVPDELILVDGWYDIQSPGQLKALAELVNSQAKAQTIRARLTADIDLGEEDWTPIGIKTFTGIFDGQGHVVSGLSIKENKNTKLYCGLFGTVSAGTIRNLVVRGSGITSVTYAGAIAGYLSNSSMIKNCLVDCPVTGTGKLTDAAGIAGYVDKSEVANCLVLSAVSNTAAATRYGLIVGNVSNKGGKVRNCYASAEGQYKGVKASDKYFANCKTQLADSLATGSVAYLLAANALATDSAAWGQTLGTDTQPRLGGSTIYKADLGMCFDYYNLEQVEKKDQIELHYVAHRLTLDDNADETLPPTDATTFRTIELAYTRANVRGYNSICLPVTLTPQHLPDGFELAILRKAWVNSTQEAEISFVPVTMLEAGKPGLFYAADEGARCHSQTIDLLFTAARDNRGEPFSIDMSREPRDRGNGATLTGTYQTVLIGEGHYKLSDSGDELLHSTAESHVYPFRWYLTLDGTRAASATRATLSIQPESGFEETAPVKSISFDLMGRRITDDQQRGARFEYRKKTIIIK